MKISESHLIHQLIDQLKLLLLLPYFHVIIVFSDNLPTLFSKEKFAHHSVQCFFVCN